MPYSLAVAALLAASLTSCGDPEETPLGQVAAKLAFRAAPSEVRAGEVIEPAIEVVVLTADDEELEWWGEVITLEVASGPDGASLEGTTRRAAFDGFAVFDDLVLSVPGEGYVLRAKGSWVEDALTEPFVVVGDAPLVAALDVWVSEEEVVAGEEVSVTMKAVDSTGEVVPGYRGTVLLSSTDEQAVLPETYQFREEDGGEASIEVELRTAGSQRIDVVDEADAALAGFVTVDVLAAGPATLSFVAQPSDGVVGEPMEPAIEVEIRDGFGNLADQSDHAVTLSLLGGEPGAQLLGTTEVQSSGGLAVFDDLVIEVAGEGYTLEADSEGLDPAVSEAFDVRAVPTAMVRDSGDGQTGAVGTELMDPLVVLVTDEQGNGVAGVALQWAATGDAQVSEAETITGADGRSSVEATLGTTVREYGFFVVVMGRALSVDFTATAHAGEAAVMEIVSGDGQEGLVGAALSEPFEVEVKDEHGNPISGLGVEWSTLDGGALSETQTTTGADGRTSVTATLGTSSGEYRYRAMVSGTDVEEEITATALPDAAAVISVVGGDEQEETVDMVLPVPLAVEVRDEHGNPVPDVTVSWHASEGASVSQEQTVTGDDGSASITATLGIVAGEYSYTATASGVAADVIFSALAKPDAPAALYFGTSSQVVTTGYCSREVRVGVLDQHQNATVAPSEISLVFSSDPAGTLSFFDDEECGDALVNDASTMEAGQAEVVVYFSGESEGSVLLEVGAQGLDPASQSQTLTDVPFVTILDGPSELTNETTASFTLDCTQQDCEFTCRLDGVAQGVVSDYESCESGVTYSGLADDEYTFTVFATDSLENESDPAAWNWTVDTVPPVVTDLAGPVDPTNETSATFTFGCSKEGCEFTCRLEGTTQGTVSDSATCDSGWTHSNLVDDDYVFTVTATCPAGNESQAAWSWTVDNVPPVVTGLSGPDDPTGDTTATFTFGCSKESCDFTCRIEGAVQGTVSAEGPCESGHEQTGLGDDDYTFTVFATDLAGNEGTPEIWSWTVDTSLPVLAITAAPPSQTRETWALFEFECTNKDDCSFECALDYKLEDEAWVTGTWEPCASPENLTDLEPAEYVFQVRATDTDGNEVQARHDWKVIGFWWLMTSAGSLHTCGVANDGGLWCWGANSSGRLGDGTTTNRSSPVHVEPGTYWVQVSAGNVHTCGVKEEGSLWCWGQNSGGQLGDGTTTSRSSPVQVGEDTDWTQVSVGLRHTASHTCAVKEDGSLWCWGRNSYGQLGDGTTEAQHSPVHVEPDTYWAWVSSGEEHTCGVMTNGTLWCWGRNTDGQLGDGTTTTRLPPTQVGLDPNWAQVAAGSNHTCGVRTNGSLWCWGDNSWGQIGDGTTTRRTSPSAIIGGCLYVTAGSGSTCMIDLDNRLWCWGRNTYGQLGNDMSNEEPNHTRMQVGTDTDWGQISAGDLHTCGVREDGALWCWGSNGSGRLGTGETPTSSYSPLQIGIGVPVATVGNRCALANDGTRWCWGRNWYGYFGDGTTTHRPYPVEVDNDTDWVQVSSHNHTCGVRTDGTLWCWGRNLYGQIGDGTTEAQCSPVHVEPGTYWAQVSAGGEHTCGVRTNGTLWCWGRNNDGQMGDGTTASRSSPVQVGEDADWAQVSARSNHTCAVKEDGSLWCWGSNTYGQLGDGTTTTRLVPTREISYDTSWTYVFAGGWHTCGLKEDGTLWCWGRNLYGQLGDGGTTNISFPVPVGSDTDWVDVSAGSSHTCGLKENGTLWCWGRNSSGQLGDGTTEDRLVPVQVGMDADWTQVSGFGSNTCAVKTDGSLWCWGSNISGQLGDGTAWKETPQQVPDP